MDDARAAGTSYDERQAVRSEDAVAGRLGDFGLELRIGLVEGGQRGVHLAANLGLLLGFVGGVGKCRCGSERKGQEPDREESLESHEYSPFIAGESDRTLVAGFESEKERLVDRVSLHGTPVLDKCTASTRFMPLSRGITWRRQHCILEPGRRGKLSGLRATMVDQLLKPSQAAPVDLLAGTRAFERQAPTHPETHPDSFSNEARDGFRQRFARIGVLRHEHRGDRRVLRVQWARRSPNGPR